MNRIRGPRLVSPSWLRLPRRTARLRLTLLAGALFLLSGATLVAVTYLLFDQTGSGQSMHGSPSGPGPSGSGSSQSSQSSDSITQAHQSIAQSAATVQRASDIHHLLVDFGIALGIVAVLAVLAGWFFAGRMLRPVRTITATARRISASNLKERLSLDDADEEFKQLGETLDDLFARLDAAFEAQQHFVANASHELRTPLTAERTLLQVALDDPHTTNATWRSTAEEVLASSDEQERLIEALLTLASSEGGLDHRERIDLAAICDDVLQRPGLDVDTLGLHVETAICSAPLDGDPRLIERLVANLLDNAIGHNVTGGHVQLATTVTDRRQRRAHRNQHRSPHPARRDQPAVPAIPAPRLAPHPPQGRPRARPVHRASRRHRPRRCHHRSPQAGRRTQHRGHLPAVKRQGRCRPQRFSRCPHAST